MTFVDLKSRNTESSEMEELREISVQMKTLYFHDGIMRFNKMEGKDDQQTHPLKRW